MASPSKLVTADNFFPKKDILRPQKMPAIFHDDLKELGLIDVWGMDMTVDDEASWYVRERSSILAEFSVL